ncbi:hypothetical protein P3T76_015902 [Phytophthora citrophthora]|uniref:Uncharacterized protein n=1 Tax=Phytophthora citrophthora TaxID=4793 RepID=A0AAD9FYM7_9STRA|nr:hypothetical protein P3T76_015902 [Phytophthora citrophthora]
MTSIIDPRAFAIAIELTTQLSSDGAFVDDHQRDVWSDDDAQISGNDGGDDSFTLDSEGAQVFREAIPDSVDIDTSTAGLSSNTSDSSTRHTLKPCLSWWSLIEHMVDVSREDLLAMGW